jgi:hypothetical protein
MVVKVLDVFVYERDGWTWHQESYFNPAWEEVETAIRRLDKFCYPWVFLRLDEGQDTAEDRFEIMGGPGAYWLAGSFKGYFQRRYVNPSGGSKEVAVWTSDQGFADEERHICKEIEIVLRAARYFADHADFDPAVTWEDQQRQAPKL